MKKLIAVFIAFTIGLALTSFAKEKEGGDHKTGDKGVITGEIIKKDGPKISVRGEEKTLALIPYWRGGMPADGGGFEKEMVAKLKNFKVGDRVKVAWRFEEHYRIDSIEKTGGGDRKREEK
jgi:hypothetical protein